MEKNNYETYRDAILTVDHFISEMEKGYIKHGIDKEPSVITTMAALKSLSSSLHIIADNHDELKTKYIS